MTLVKLGGSLLDLPDLPRRVHHWLRTEAPVNPLFLIGGGAAVDLIRDANRMYPLGGEQCHWLAIRAMSLNAHLVAAMLPRAQVVERIAQCPEVWTHEGIPVLDPFPWLEADEARDDRLPHNWEVTSDSIAARVALAEGAEELVLLKSRPAPLPHDWPALAAMGLVDPWFPRLAARLRRIRVVDLRSP